MKAIMVAGMCVGAGLVLAATEAQAISRYNSTSMGCERIRATVRNEGAVILRWRGNSGVQRYGRFVANNRFCESGTRAQTSYVPSADRRSCPVRECKYWSPDDDFIWRRGWRD